MNKSIIERVEKEADYLLQTQSTVREIAKIFEVSKSTVHKDLQERLLEMNQEKHNKIQEIFQQHVETRHIKGGESTRKRYLKLKKEKEEKEEFAIEK